jgi:hypothetical protein
MKTTIEVRDLTDPYSDALKPSARSIEERGEDDARYLHVALLMQSGRTFCFQSIANIAEGNAVIGSD